MLSQEESTERFDDNNEDDDDFVTWDKYKANEFKDLAELEDEDLTDPWKLEDMSMMEEDKVLFFVRKLRNQIFSFNQMCSSLH